MGLIRGGKVHVSWKKICEKYWIEKNFNHVLFIKSFKIIFTMILNLLDQYGNKININSNIVYVWYGSIWSDVIYIFILLTERVEQ